MKHLKEADLILSSYGEDLGPKASQHLRHCPQCQKARTEIARELAPLSQWQVPDKPSDYGQTVWAHLEPRLTQALPELPRPKTVAKWYWVGAVAALLVIAFFLGRLQPSQPWSIQGQDGSQRILNDRLAEHLEQTTQVFAQIESPQQAPNENKEAETLRWLLRNNRMYRQALSQNQTAATTEVLEEVEFILLQLNHPGPTTTLPSHLSEGVSEILPKLRQLKTSLESQAPPSVPDENF